VNLLTLIMLVAAAITATSLSCLILVHSRPARYATLIVGAMIVIPSSVAAAAADNPVNVPEDSTGTVFVLSAWWVTFIIASVIPLVTSLLTRLGTTSFVKYAITVVLNAVSAALTTELAEDGAKIISGQTAMTWLFGVLISLAAYEGWKTRGLTSSYYTPRAGQEPIPGKLATVGVK
jgi:hypothetical protein